MNRINQAGIASTLRQPAELVAHGLVAGERTCRSGTGRGALCGGGDAGVAALIDPDDPDDPIARQFIPSAEELATRRTRAPIRSAITPIRRSTGIVHRYPDRVLFKLVHVCAVYCRFCFRREMVGPGKASALSQRQPTTRRSPISARIREIWEVILTGGDPLMLSPRRLAEIMARSRRHRSRQDRPHSHPHAGRRSRARSAPRWSRRSRSRAPRPGSRCTPTIRAN